MAQASTAQLMEDLRKVIFDVEELLKATAGQAGEKLGEARVRAEKTLRGAQLRLGALEEQTLERARVAAGEADRYVHENPWQSIGVAAGVAFLLGILVSRR